ncbi:hypothetical protein PVAP13_4NG046142 [Panicum virgatum]|uniref:Uncharacterized protein n=1 Tax=Panicum virgatum TaxID=38727 RepID=A0A8T0TEW4_PANVG|nr:hypothetical protein PVAP13_4NG046142 [Panicum virgatum]
MPPPPLARPPSLDNAAPAARIGSPNSYSPFYHRGARFANYHAAPCYAAYCRLPQALPVPCAWLRLCCKRTRPMPVTDRRSRLAPRDVIRCIAVCRRWRGGAVPLPAAAVHARRERHPRHGHSRLPGPTPPAAGARPCLQPRAPAPRQPARQACAGAGWRRRGEEGRDRQVGVVAGAVRTACSRGGVAHARAQQ